MAILIGCFTGTLFPLRESTAIMSGNVKGFTLEESFQGVHSLSSKFSFQFSEKLFQSSVDELLKHFLLLNYIIVYFIYLSSKAAIGFTELFSIFFQFL